MIQNEWSVEFFPALPRCVDYEYDVGYLKSKNYISEFFIERWQVANKEATEKKKSIAYRVCLKHISQPEKTANPIKVNSWHMTIKGPTGPFIANKD
ncbi:hypothetical protein BpHYR1_027448 [Brachionus plicatilis]|uniref:Uncharacterized protein n=1 Tax=Brachionus plicatilis TaxID=10195 RepID=A0A3M7Q503_BRAPC|nr:hypothetical protein BpHYR1_027448 [Brachionus plicatilis]